MPKRTGGWWPVAALIGVTALWGWTFVIVHDAVSRYPVLPFLTIRFALAALILSPAALYGVRSLAYGIAPGLALAVGYLAQTEGLRYTTASKAGLLTGLFVVITPVLVFGLARQRPPVVTAFAVATALVGTTLLAATGSHASPHEMYGDALELLTALAFSIHILLLARIPKEVNTAAVALAQMMVAAIVFTACTVALNAYSSPSRDVWIAALITGILASAVAFWIQTSAQQRLSPQRIAVILTCEPAFATAFGVLLAGDRFSPVQAVGAAVIFGAVVAHETWPLWNPRLQLAGS